MENIYGSLSDIVTAFAAVFALCFGFHQLRQVSGVRDLEFLNAHREQIGEHWRRYRQAVLANSNDIEFEFGELLDCYERTCFALNQRMVGKQTRSFMRDHVLEVILQLISDADTYQRMRALISGPRTYKEIAEFCLNNRKTVDEIHKSQLEALFGLQKKLSESPTEAASITS